MPCLCLYSARVKIFRVAMSGGTASLLSVACRQWRQDLALKAKQWLKTYLK